MLDHHDRIAIIAQAMQHSEQHLDIVKMQPCCGLVEDIQGAARIPFGELAGQLYPLGLAAGQGRGTLAEPDI